MTLHDITAGAVALLVASSHAVTHFAWAFVRALAARRVAATPPAKAVVTPSHSIPERNLTMAFNLTSAIAALEPAVLALIAGAASSATPIEQIDPQHPVATAAVDISTVAGKALAAAVPDTATFAPIVLQLAKAWIAANASKPA